MIEADLKISTFLGYQLTLSRQGEIYSCRASNGVYDIPLKFGISPDTAESLAKLAILKNKAEDSPTPTLIIQDDGVVLLFVNLLAATKWNFCHFHKRINTLEGSAITKLFYSVPAIAELKRSLDNKKLSFSYKKEKLSFNVEKYVIGGRSISLLSQV